MDGMVTALAIIFPVLLVFSHDRLGVRRIGSVRHWRAESREISLSCQWAHGDRHIAQFGPISISPHPRVIHLPIAHTVTPAYSHSSAQPTARNVSLFPRVVLPSSSLFLSFSHPFLSFPSSPPPLFSLPRHPTMSSDQHRSRLVSWNALCPL
jgi:hypothetical protein